VCRTPRTQFHAEPYELGLSPIVHAKIAPLGGSPFEIDAYVDSGCTVGLSLTERQVSQLGLSLGQKINSSPEPCTLADGNTVACDIYVCEVEVGGEKRSVNVAVVDTTQRLESEGQPEDEALLGKAFMDYFDVTFSGIDRTLIFVKEP
jgi:predicted aspartyl protease